MKLFTKFKHAVEAWLRTLIADEVSKIDVSLQHEKQALAEQITSLKNAVDRILESSYFVENSQLRQHIKTLNEKIADVHSTIEQIHPAKLYTGHQQS